ncbi:MAG: bifunctional phosphopantothenoylcysteine decarboxylase/phosphopantothenate--cysteine ligase CoaBC [Acidobacteriota bacterium]
MSEAPLVALGVTGGIAAYKACELVRRLQDAGVAVKVVMTDAAQKLVAPLTFETLSGQPVITSQWDAPEEHAINHISLARHAALLLIAPATANCVGKLAHGIADDFLTTMALATRAPIVVAPAMNTAMWESAAVQSNVATLRERGVGFVMPGSGDLACGEEGAGRLADVADIVAQVLQVLSPRRSLSGLEVFVNGGPTREPVDAVRVLSNRSSGRMGIALAEAARRRGAAVRLVLGPTLLAPPPGCRTIRVETAAEMLRATLEHVRGVDAAVLSAAVSDFRPRRAARGKVKKAGAPAHLELEPTEDILLRVAREARPRVLVGFAAESGDPGAEARRKAIRKDCDLVVGNDISASDAGFEVETNRAVLVGRSGRREDTGLMSKDALAHLVWDRVLDLLGRP